MNNRVIKDFEQFIYQGQNLLCVEKALYALLDKFKDDRIRNNGSTFPQDYHKVIQECFDVLRLHENYLKNKDFFIITVPRHDPDPVKEVLGETKSKRQVVAVA